VCLRWLRAVPLNADWNLVGTTIQLAHAVGLTVAAESVETAAQFTHLLRLGCETGQGWFFAGAVSADAIPGLMSAWVG
jgi:EAL domain-containing protein (putative c-di-GMP-specific phosphodiesterase class I)